MQHCRQTTDACLAYALLQLGVVDREAVAQYEQIIVRGELSADTIYSWLASIGLADQISVHWAEPPARGTEPLSGTGIAILELSSGPIGAWARHAVSYENGLLLDPGCDLGKPETLEELKTRLLAKGWWHVKLISVRPVSVPARQQGGD